MRICLIVLMALLMTLQAHAQGKPRGGSNASPKEEAEAAEKLKQRKANESAAKAAMERIPDSKEKYDPWQSAR